MESLEFKSDSFLEGETVEGVVKEIKFSSEVNNKNKLIVMLPVHTIYC